MDGTRDLLEQLSALSRFYGDDPAMVLAGGGNTSVKHGDRMWVKASGIPLSGIGPDGFVEMDRTVLAAHLENPAPEDEDQREARFKDAVMSARVHLERGQRPSVEAALHHLLPYRFVVHTHATLANALTCCVNGEGLAREALGGVLWVPYTDPGDTLARSVQTLLGAYAAREGDAAPRAILMENHGLIVAGETPDEVRAATDDLLGRIAALLKAAPPADRFRPAERIAAPDARALINVLGPALRGLLAEVGRRKVVMFDDSEPSLLLAASDEGPAIAAGGPLTPDQIVYCKSFPLVFTPWIGESAAEMVERLRTEVSQHHEEHGSDPKVVIARGLGLFAAGDDYAAADTVRKVYIDAIRVMAAADRLGGIRYMSRRDREFIDAWEVESYRRSVAARERRHGRGEGRVALVTGAAQGFGLGIARALAEGGAHVALSDVNAGGVADEAEALSEAHGSGRAIGLGMDVTDENSVADAFHSAVRTYGGVDVLVSNAGVLRAGSVHRQPLSEFDLVTRVNYTGYFLCAQAAARVMAVQNRARPGAWSDIIQVNSKSGLVGSNRNGAYAGSKFAGVGLTQSLALELVEDGIKVNAVCPGNFFEGPLWSDPESGLFAQYLREGKVPGAETVEDVRRHYESRVPMGRGCRVEDVMAAIWYILEQQYETGQAVPVTGGQVMLG